MPHSPGTLRAERRVRRANAYRRGYDKRWQSLSRRVRTDTPLCVVCLAAGTYTPAEDVHHIEPIRDAPTLRLARTNLVALCRECHGRVERGEVDLPETPPGGWEL